MGRKSTNPDKSIYQLIREEAGLTREQASELMECISPQRIEKIENGRVTVQPEDVIIMARCYKEPSLLNYYCTEECAIGRVHMQKVEEKNLGQITIETINTLNKLDEVKNRLLEIAEDGTLSDEREYEDFARIKELLDKVSQSVSALQLWIDKGIATGTLDRDKV